LRTLAAASCRAPALDPPREGKPDAQLNYGWWMVLAAHGGPGFRGAAVEVRARARQHLLAEKEAGPRRLREQRGQKAAPMKPIKVGVHIPPPPPEGQPASIYTPGVGCITAAAHQALMERLPRIEGIELYPDVRFRESFILNGKVYVDSFCLNDLDLLFWYCEVDRRVGSYELEVLHTLAADVKVVVNPRAFAVGLDKYRAHLALKRAGVSVADTVLVDHRNLRCLEALLREWRFAVLKPRRGGFGKGVTLIDSFAALRDTIEYVYTTTGQSPDSGYLVERFYPHDRGDWVSTTIVNGELVYGYRKRSPKFVDFGHGFRKVYDASELGGEVDFCAVPAAYRREALKAYAAIGAEIIGFDLVAAEGRPIVVDENTFPGYYDDLFRLAGQEPADALFRLIVAEIDKVQHSLDFHAC
jgi:glutathione synthase/RimK-type ligase-like ATP-grasp enzyme